MTDLTQLNSHFAFGKNWESYARTIDAAKIREAELGLRRLLDDIDLRGKTFLDIGCGSGLHSLAALRLGAKSVTSCDLDPDSVATTKAVLAQHALGTQYNVLERSVFDMTPQSMGEFDIVYSWGVLHHTGNMKRALNIAASLVSRKGALALALYRRTFCCALWTVEKKWYAGTTPELQRRARRVFLAAYSLRLRLAGRSLEGYMGSYLTNRGMDFMHDLHDWMGGYPYESISPRKLDEHLVPLGMKLRQCFTVPSWTHRIGAFGSGCDEFLYARA